LLQNLLFLREERLKTKSALTFTEKHRLRSITKKSSRKLPVTKKSRAQVNKNCNKTLVTYGIKSRG
jgi:hypothetical protein